MNFPISYPPQYITLTTNETNAQIIKIYNSINKAFCFFDKLDKKSFHASDNLMKHQNSHS